MPALTAPNQVGVREDVSDLLYLSDVKETPFVSTVRKGPKPIDPMLWQYGVKRRGQRKPGGVPDGQDVNAFDSVSPRDFLQARSEVWRRAPMVGFIAQRRSLNGGVAGVNNEMDEAVADHLIEIKRDMEKELLSNQDSRADDGISGSKTRGVGRWLWNSGTAMGAGRLAADDDWSSLSAFTDLPIVSGYQIPQSQIYTAASFSTAFLEAQLNTLIQSKWDNTGASSELRGFVSAIIKNQVGFFSRYNFTVASHTPRLQVTNGSLEGNTLMGPTVDIYKSDWGTFTLHPVASDFLPTLYTGYFMDMKQVSLRVTENTMTTELPDLGGGPRKMIQAIAGLEIGDPRAHVKIDAAA